MFRHRSANGFSLIELLVSIVIFGVGLLAVAGLQTVSKRANFEGFQRTVASQIGYGLLEDLRSNGNGINVYLAAPDLGGGVIGTEPAPNCANVASTCNAAEKAVHDLWFWEQLLDGGFETGAAGASGGILSPTICIDGPVGGGPGAYAITVAWRGSASMTDDGSITCGAGSGKYGSSNEFRRAVQVPTFIDPAF